MKRSMEWQGVLIFGACTNVSSVGQGVGNLLDTDPSILGKTAYGALYWLYEGETLLERRERLSENPGDV